VAVAVAAAAAVAMAATLGDAGDISERWDRVLISTADGE
tara:strand:- start:79 stop:195 length:117 start_codon:yes stop_codon:yes gene_type:complete